MAEAEAEAEEEDFDAESTMILPSAEDTSVASTLDLGVGMPCPERPTR